MDGRQGKQRTHRGGWKALLTGLVVAAGVAWHAGPADATIRVGNSEIQVVYEMQHTFQFHNDPTDNFEWVQWRNELRVEYEYQDLVEVDRGLFGKNIKIPGVRRADFSFMYRGRFDPVFSGAGQVRRHVSGLDQEPAQIVRVPGERVPGDEPGRGLRGRDGAPAVDEAGQATDRVGRVGPVPLSGHRKSVADRSERVHRGSVRGLSDADLGGEVSVRPGEHREPDLERGVGSVLHAALAADHAAPGAGRRLGRPPLRGRELRRGCQGLLPGGIEQSIRRGSPGGIPESERANFDDRGRALGTVQRLDAHPASVVHLPGRQQRQSDGAGLGGPARTAPMWRGPSIPTSYGTSVAVENTRT